jgi:hypothetical protein
MNIELYQELRQCVVLAGDYAEVAHIYPLLTSRRRDKLTELANAITRLEDRLEEHRQSPGLISLRSRLKIARRTLETLTDGV